jgi:hypothetical protein
VPGIAFKSLSRRKGFGVLFEPLEAKQLGADRLFRFGEDDAR